MLRIISLIFIGFLLVVFFKIYAPILNNSNVFIYDSDRTGGVAVRAIDLMLGDSLLSTINEQYIKDPAARESLKAKASIVKCTYLESGSSISRDLSSRDLVSLNLEGPTMKEADYIFMVPDTVVYDVYNKIWVTVEDLDVGISILGSYGSKHLVLGKTTIYRDLINTMKIYAKDLESYFIQSARGVPIVVKTDN